MWKILCKKLSNMELRPKAIKDFGIIDFWKKNQEADGRGVVIGLLMTVSPLINKDFSPPQLARESS